MSGLRKIRDEDRESQIGYVFAVSGPGKFSNIYHFSSHLFNFSVQWMRFCLDDFCEEVSSFGRI